MKIKLLSPYCCMPVPYFCAFRKYWISEFSLSEKKLAFNDPLTPTLGLSLNVALSIYCQYSSFDTISISIHNLEY
jgi:hypothetical protein